MLKIDLRAVWIEIGDLCELNDLIGVVQSFRLVNLTVVDVVADAISSSFSSAAVNLNDLTQNHRVRFESSECVLSGADESESDLHWCNLCPFQKKDGSALSACCTLTS